MANLKQKVSIEVLVHDMKYEFLAPVGVTYSNCIDACFEVMQELHKLQAEAIEAVKPKEA